MKEDRQTGVRFLPEVLSGSDVVELAQGVERLGYDMLRYPKGIGYETFNYSGFILVGTDRLHAAAGIANICARDALTAVSGHDSLSNFYDNRFILGLGVSRVTLAESFCGHDDDKPVTTMRAYLVAMGSGFVVQGAVIGTLPARP